ncbi:MAG: phosphoglycerate kinase [Nitrospira sp.]|nr:phosphoglycerate kinase [Nitrospira sp.]
MRLWLCRHAPVLVEPGVCYGASDVPFDETATQVAAKKIATWLPKACVVWASPSSRAAVFARQLVQFRPDLNLAIDPRLAEADFGTWELKKWHDIPKTDLDTWVASFALYTPGGGESVYQLMLRVTAALDHLQDLQVPEALWVTHAGVIRAAQFMAIHGVRKLPEAQNWPDTPIPFGEPLPLDL